MQATSERRILTVSVLMVVGLLSLAPPQLGAVPEESAEVRLGEEIRALAERLAIPGLAWGVVQDGNLLLDGAAGYSGAPDRPFTVGTPLDIASISKSIAAVAIMQAVERGELKLSDPVLQYLPDFSGPAEITIANLLSHTSEGIPGDEYLYAPARYVLLGSILEEITGQPYASIVRTRVLDPAGMEEHDSPDLTAGWGMISTTENLLKYAIALDRDLLMERSTQDLMATPLESPRGIDLPVNLGWFCQVIQQEPVAWGYGQGDDTSLLFLRVPRLRLTLVIAAESDKLSNPFRLLHGDVRSSPFAMAFFRNFVAASPPGSLPSPDWTIRQIAELEAELDACEESGSYRFGDELVANALLESFHNEDAGGAGDLLELALRRYPDSVPSLSWLELANAVERESLRRFSVRLANLLVRTRPTSPWVLTVAGDTYLQSGKPRKAIATWSRVAALPNQLNGFINVSLNAAAWNNIGQHWLDSDPRLAQAFFLRAIESEGGWELPRSERLLREALDRQGPPRAYRETGDRFRRLCRRGERVVRARLSPEGERRQLTSLGRFLEFPLWSPGGNGILATVMTEETADLVLLDATTGDPTTLVAGHGNLADWGPEGRRVLLPRDQGESGPGLYIFDVESGEQQRIDTGSEADAYARWGRDGSALVYESGRDGNPEIYITDMVSGGTSRLTDNQDLDEWPSLSPDGAHIAWASGNEEEKHLWVMRADGTDKRQITEGMLFGDAFPEWSPDGSRILLTVNENDVFVLKLIDLGSGSITDLGPGAAASWR